jgi:hypothetical protein
MELDPVPITATRFPSHVIVGFHEALWAKTPVKESKPAISGPE